MDIPAGTLETLLREDGIEVPDSNRDEKMIHCFGGTHEDTTPSMAINRPDNLYFCQSCKIKGNAYNYLNEHRSLEPREAWKVLERFSGAKPASAAKAQKKKLTWTQNIYPTLFDRPKIAEHEYRLADGRLICTVARYDKPKGADGPKCLPFTPCSTGGWWRHDPLTEGLPEEDKRLDGKRPLYRLPELLKALEKEPGRQIMIVEGEKCVDRVLGVPDFGDRGPTPCTTAMFAKFEITRTDFSPLEGQTVLLMADEDQAGRDNMLALAQHLAAECNCEVRTFLPPGNAPARGDSRGITGYDIADAIDEGGWGEVKKWFSEVGAREFKPSEPAPPPAVFAPLAESDHFRTLGLYGTENVAILRKETHEIQIVKRTMLASEGVLTVIAPLSFWVAQAEGQGFGPSVRRGFGDALLRACEKKGHIDMQTVTGRGAARIGNTFVYNLGGKILTQDDNGRLTKEISIGQAEGLFQPGAPIEVRDDDRAAEYGKALYDAVMRYRWLAEVDGRAFLGWIVTSLVGGALPFRPMVWIVAPAAAGKTYLLDHVLGPVLKPCLLALTDASEAGIAGRMGTDSLPCYLDEFEPRRGQESKFESILTIVRSATSGDGGRLRGSAGNAGTVMHNPRFSMLMSSIHRPPLSTADDSRFFTLRLSPHMVKNWPDVRRGIEAATEADKMIALRTHIIRSMASIIRQANSIEDELQALGGLTTREAQIIAALTAGAGFLSGDYTFVRRRQGVKDDTYAVFATLLSAFVRSPNGGEITLAEVLRKAYWSPAGFFVPDGHAEDYVATAERYGMKMATETTMYLATEIEAQRQLMRNTEYANVDLSDYFRRLPGVAHLKTVKGVKRRLRFAGQQRITLLANQHAVEGAGFVTTRAQGLEPEEEEAITSFTEDEEHADAGSTIPF